MTEKLIEVVKGSENARNCGTSPGAQVSMLYQLDNIMILGGGEYISV